MAKTWASNSTSCVKWQASGGGTSRGKFVDLGVPGTVSSRPELDRVMAEARAGRVDPIAVFRFDRFARDTQHLLTALDELRCLGGNIISQWKQVDTSSPMGKAMFTIIAVVAQLERDIIRARIIAGVRRAQAAGKHCGRPRVEMDLRPALALLHEGRSLKTIARILQVSRNALRRRLRSSSSHRRPFVPPRGPHRASRRPHPNGRCRPPFRPSCGDPGDEDNADEVGRLDAGQEAECNPREEVAAGENTADPVIEEVDDVGAATSEEGEPAARRPGRPKSDMPCLPRREVRIPEEVFQRQEAVSEQTGLSPMDALRLLAHMGWCQWNQDETKRDDCEVSH